MLKIHVRVPLKYEGTYAKLELELGRSPQILGWELPKRPKFNEFAMDGKMAHRSKVFDCNAIRRNLENVFLKRNVCLIVV
jgi:hypothetical protein